MNLAIFLDPKSATYGKYLAALNECCQIYPTFDVYNPLHQMFAVSMMMLQEMERKENQEW